MLERGNHPYTSHVDEWFGASVSALTASTDWKVLYQVSESGCIAELGPFDGPDVLIAPDLEIFADDISFSDDNPDPGETITVFATIHNVSSYAAENI